MASRKRMLYIPVRPGSSIPASFLMQVMEQDGKKRSVTVHTLGGYALIAAMLVLLVYFLGT